MNVLYSLKIDEKKDIKIKHIRAFLKATPKKVLK